MIHGFGLDVATSGARTLLITEAWQHVASDTQEEPLR